MFREMRRKRQLLSAERSSEILAAGTSGVLALQGDDGYPYAVPLSYVYDGHDIYFHSARCGHKIDAASGCDKVSFCVIESDDIVSSEYTTYFRSVIVFGRISVIEDGGEKREAMEKLAVKYSPAENSGARATEIDKEWDRLAVLRLRPEHITGKEAIELVRKV